MISPNVKMFMLYVHLRVVQSLLKLVINDSWEDGKWIQQGGGKMGGEEGKWEGRRENGRGGGKLGGEEGKWENGRGGGEMGGEGRENGMGGGKMGGEEGKWEGRRENGRGGGERTRGESVHCRAMLWKGSGGMYESASHSMRRGIPYTVNIKDQYVPCSAREQCCTSEYDKIVIELRRAKWKVRPIHSKYKCKPTVELRIHDATNWSQK
jgi:hypothetical protein